VRGERRRGGEEKRRGGEERRGEERNSNLQQLLKVEIIFKLKCY